MLIAITDRTVEINTPPLRIRNASFGSSVNPRNTVENPRIDPLMLCAKTKAIKVAIGWDSLSRFP